MSVSSVRKSVMDRVLAALETITEANGYNTTVGSVSETLKQYDQIPSKEIPCLMPIDADEVRGWEAISGLDLRAELTAIISCVIKSGMTNIIDRGNCESATAPMMLGESEPSLVQCTFARSSDFARSGTYSYKLTKTIAAGTAALARQTDNGTNTDMHGVVPGEMLDIECYVYIPTASGIAAAEVSIQAQYYDGAWISLATADAASELDEWERLAISGIVPTTATGFQLRLEVESTAALNEYFYVDDLRVARRSMRTERLGLMVDIEKCLLNDSALNDLIIDIEPMNIITDKGTIPNYSVWDQSYKITYFYSSANGG